MNTSDHPPHRLVLIALILGAGCGAGGPSAPGVIPTSGPSPASVTPSDPLTGCAILDPEEVAEVFGIAFGAAEGSVAISGQVYFCSYRAIDRVTVLNTIYSPANGSQVAATEARSHEPVADVGDAAFYDETKSTLWITKNQKGFTLFGSFHQNTDPKTALIAIARKAAARL